MKTSIEFMNAAVINRYGPPEVLEYTEISRPLPGYGEVLVHVQAASVNPVDWKIRRGDIKLISGFSFPKVVGTDFAGKVAALGRGVTHLKPGDDVYGQVNSITGMGTYAEYVVASASSIAPKPAFIDYVKAAAIPVAGLTALQGLRDLVQLRPGQHVLINGAGGGVGSFAVQLARIMGAEVTAVCSSGDTGLVKRLGADHVIDYTQTDFTQGTTRYDVVFDVAATSSLSESTPVIREKGYFLSTMPTPRNFIMLGITALLPVKKVKVCHVTPSPADLEYLAQLVADGKLQVEIDTVYSLAEAAKAHDHSENGHVQGKIVLRVAE
jgi:NADPH:quinone reductase-like Zn-dependent oxidoreductase